MLVGAGFVSVRDIVFMYQMFQVVLCLVREVSERYYVQIFNV